MMLNPPRTLLISILSLGRQDNVLRQLETLPSWLSDLAAETGITSHIIIRNNDPAISFSEVADRVEDIQITYAGVACTLVSGLPNSGFGGGHNRNITMHPSDFVLILNDDIGFPHMAWLGEALAMLQGDPAMACVAAEGNPRHINPLFGNGLLPGSFHLHSLTYGEASILLCSSDALKAAGAFHPDFAWAMCEDADLSLRWQQLGYRIGFITMPHEHWRSSSFNSLPGPVKSSILEHNRAALFANWRESFATGRIGRFEVYDIWSDGLGDVFCALPHLLAQLAPLSAARRSHVVVNTSHPELFAWLGLEGVRVESEPDLMRLRATLATDGITTIRSIRDANFSLPFNIHPLLAGTLGLRPADATARASFAACLSALRPPRQSLPLPGSYAVLHLEFERSHDGRALSPAAMSELLKQCGDIFGTVVLVGRGRCLSVNACGTPSAKIIDLQGALSRTQLAAVIASAGFFVGIDSFPAHIAQACEIPAAVFFGAVHPLTRVWQAGSVWPLMADLDCIGCYHTHLEPSVPFCMRRDQACTTELPASMLRAVLRQMAEGRAYDWAKAELGLQALQARMLKLTRYHPAPAERLFKGQNAPNENVSNMIYQIANQMGDLLRGQYQTTTMDALLGQVQELQTEVFNGRVMLDEARRNALARAAAPQRAREDNPHAPSIMQLSTLDMQPVRCSFKTDKQWITVESDEDDPQLLLPPIRSSGSKVQLRLSFLAQPGEALHVYWTIGQGAFSEENLRIVLAESSVVTANLVFDVRNGDVLRIRIDPLTGSGSSRLHGSLGGAMIVKQSQPPGGAHTGREQPFVKESTPLIPVRAGLRAPRRQKAT